MTTYRVCVCCPLDDNRWAESEFFPGMARCKACYTAQKRLAQELKPFPAAERARIRKHRGICQECPNPVDGVVGKTRYCAACRRRLRQARERKHKRKPDVRARIYARKRELHRERMAGNPEYRAEYRRRRQRETLFSNPSRAKYLATQERHNRNPIRAEIKRQMAIAKYYELHPVRPDPVCATCEKPIDWTPPGRPPKYHQTPACNPHWATSRHARELRMARAA